MKLTVQFYLEGQPLGPPLLVPADSTASELSAALRSLEAGLGNTEFVFAANKRIVNASLYKDSIEGTGFSAENVVAIDCIKTDKFVVKPISRTTATLSGHQGPVLACQFSCDSRLLATGSGDKTVRIWDTMTMTPIKVLSEHKGWILALAWSPCDAYVASGDSEGQVYVWNRDGSLKATFSGHKKWITSLSWEPVSSSSRLVSSSKDGTCRIWSLSRAGCDACLSHADSVTSVKWTENDRIISGSHDRTIKIWNSAGSLIATQKGHGHWINSLATNRDFFCRNICNADLVSKISFSKVTKIASCSDDSTLLLWQSDLTESTKLVGHQNVVNHIAFSPDGLYLASASFDKSVKIWCGVSGKFLGTLRGHVGPVFQLSWSSDSKLLMSVSRDSTAKVWEISSMKLKTNLAGHLDEVYCVDWSPNGELAATGGKDQKVLMYSCESADDVRRWRN